MKKFNLAFAIAALFVISSASFAYDRNNSHSRGGHNGSYGGHNSHQRSRSNYGRRGHRNKHSSYANRSNHYNKSYGYQGNSNYNRHNYGSSYNTRHNGHYKYSKYSKYSHYGNYNSYGHKSKYYYKPLRGIGHYYARDGYGYGHWHDAMWCDDRHSNGYYQDYYAANPFSGGWRSGDGDYGINLYLNY